jgi:ribokinase
MSTEPGEGRFDVLVLGDLFCDLATMPIAGYPERDRQLGCQFQLTLGGQAGNCAAACASLGLKTALIAKLGHDVLSHWARSELERLGVHLFASVTEKAELQHPGITVSITFTDGSRSMLSDRGANNGLREADVNLALLEKARFVMRAGHWNTEGLFAANRKILETAQAAGAQTGVDIGWSAYLGWTAHARSSVFALLPATEFLFLNAAELEGLSGTQGMKGARELLARGCKHVILHQGAQGSSWVTRDFEISSSAYPVEPINPTGVGDVFNAGFICAILAGMDPDACLRFANACAATYISTKRRGNVFPAPRDVARFLDQPAREEDR